MTFSPWAFNALAFASTASVADGVIEATRVARRCCPAGVEGEPVMANIVLVRERPLRMDSPESLSALLRCARGITPYDRALGQCC